jgi:putative oligomerization/nucleic acid binding protein
MSVAESGGVELGQLNGMVGKPAARGENNTLTYATIVDPSAFVVYKGSKLHGAIVVNDEALYLQGVRDSRIIRRPLVRWSWVSRIEIDGLHSPGRVEGCSTLVVSTYTGQLAWTLPIDPIFLRNLLGRVIAQVETQPTMRVRQTSGPLAATESVADELGKLAVLRDSGVLTSEEFADQKAKLLAR